MNTWNKEYVVRLIYSHLKTHKHSPTKENCCLMYFPQKIYVTSQQCFKKVRDRQSQRNKLQILQMYRETHQFHGQHSVTAIRLFVQRDRFGLSSCFYTGGLSKYLDRGVRMRDKNPYPILDHNQLDFPTLSSTPEDKNPLSFISSIRSDEGLTFETSAFESLYGS